MVPKIVVESVPNPNFRNYHVNTEISQVPTLDFWRPLRESSKEYLERAGEVGSTLLRKVFDIPGVNHVIMEPYVLSVIKGEAFDWEEVEPPVLEAIKQAFGELEQEVVVSEKEQEAEDQGSETE